MNTLQSLESDLALEPIPHHREARRTGRLAGRLRVVLPAVALLLLGPIFYHGMLTAGWAPANYDFVTYFVPYREYLVHAWTHGRPLPLWNSSVFLGAPFLANIQAAVLYPPNLLLLLPLRAETAVSWLLALHLGLAGAGMYLYALIGIRLRMPGSLVTALLFMLGSLMIGQADHVNQTNTLAWTPWLLLAADRTAVLPTPTRVAAVAVAVALVVLAGHTQQAYYTFVLVLLVVAARLWVLVVRRRWFRRAALGASALAAGVVLGGGIIALQLAATLELVRQSYRAAGLSAAVNAQGSLPLNGVLDNLLPNYVSEPSAESATAVGSAALLLIAIALLARWRRPSVAGWGLLAIAALVAALGPRGHLYDLLVRLLPGFGLFREPTRLVVFITISASILAGHGVLVVQQLATACRRPAWRRRTARVLLVAGTASLAPAAAFAAMFLAGDPRHGVLRVFPTVIPAENVLLIAALPIAALLLAVLAVGGPRRVRTVAIQVMLPLLVLADLWLLEMPTYPLNPVPDSLYRDRPAAAALLPSGQDQRYLTLAQTPVAPSGDLPSGLTPVAAHRYSSNRVLIDSLMPDVGMASLPPDADGYDGGLLPLGSYVSFRAPLLPPGSSNPPDYSDRISTSQVHDVSWLRQAGVGVVLTPVGVNPNTAACPGCLVPGGSAGGMQAWRLAGGQPARARLESGTPASVVSDSGDRVVVRLPSGASGRLILADTYYPGWTATVDGRKATIQRYDGYLRAVSIPPDAREVTFNYQPGWLGPGLTLSLAATAATAALAASPLLLAFRRRRRRE